MPDARACLSVHCESDYGNFIDWLTTELAPTILGNKLATVVSFMDCAHQARLASWRRYIMDKTDLQLTCRRDWCVYGNPDASLFLRLSCF